MAAGMWRAFAWLVTSPLRSALVVGWIAAAVGASQFLPSLRDTAGSSAALLVSPSSPAIATERQAVAAFGFPPLGQLAIVQYRSTGLSPTAQARVVQCEVTIPLRREPTLVRIRLALPVLNTGGVFPSARERGTTAIWISG